MSSGGGLFALVLAAASVSACAPRGPAPDAKADPPLPAETRWLRPEPARDVSWLDAPARTLASPESSFVVSVPMTARVVRVHVRPGQRVLKEEPLLEVLVPELLKAAGALSAAGLRVNAYQIRKARLTQLVEQGLSRAVELNDVEVNLALAEAEREAARAALRVAFVSESQAAKLLSDRGTLVLRAPSAAMVVRVTTRPGEVREPGGGALLELVGQGNVQIEARFAYAPPADARFVWLAGDASLALVYDATSPLAAPEDGSRLVWLHPADPAHAPVPGSLGRVRLQAAADWWVLPITALRTRGAEPSVLLRTEQGEREQAVTVVLRSNSEVIVRGLSANGEVAVEGHARAEQRDAGTRSGPP